MVELLGVVVAVSVVTLVEVLGEVPVGELLLEVISRHLEGLEVHQRQDIGVVACALNYGLPYLFAGVLSE